MKYLENWLKNLMNQMKMNGFQIVTELKIFHLRCLDMLSYISFQYLANIYMLFSLKRL